MSGIIQLLRPKNCLMAVLSVIIVSLIAAELDIEHIPLVEVLAASMVVFLFTGAGNTLNDYLDRDIDMVNHPERPIPSGRVNPRQAAIMSAILFVISVVVGLWLSLYCMIVILVNLAVMLAYEFKAKSMGFYGNILISWLTASLFLFAGFAVMDKFPDVLEPVAFMFLLSFFATLGREVVKDIQDVEGDDGRITLPMQVGAKKASYAATIAFLISIGLSPLPYIFGIFGFFYFLAVLSSDIVFIYAANAMSSNPRLASESAKVAMVLALVSFLLGVI